MERDAVLPAQAYSNYGPCGGGEQPVSYHLHNRRLLLAPLEACDGRLAGTDTRAATCDNKNGESPNTVEVPGDDRPMDNTIAMRHRREVHLAWLSRYSRIGQYRHDQETDDLVSTHFTQSIETSYDAKPSGSFSTDITTSVYFLAAVPRQARSILKSTMTDCAEARFGP